MSERQGIGEFARDHWKEALVAGVAVAAGATALLAAKAIQNKRRSRVEDEPLRSEMSREEMLERLDVLNDPVLRPENRKLLAGVAARIFYATHNSEANIITHGALIQHFEDDEVPMGVALGLLEVAGLIGRRESTVDVNDTGYFAEAPLSWALTDDDSDRYPDLQLALAEILSER